MHKNISLPILCLDVQLFLWPLWIYRLCFKYFVNGAIIIIIIIIIIKRN